MARYETTITANFEDFIRYCNNEVLSGSLSASLEDGSDFTIDHVKIAVRVYERYSMIGSNRVSLNLTFVGIDDQVALSAITSGGSQAMLFKLNTFGEEAFLDKFIKGVEAYQR